MRMLFRNSGWTSTAQWTSVIVYTVPPNLGVHNKFTNIKSGTSRQTAEQNTEHSEAKLNLVDPFKIRTSDNDVLMKLCTFIAFIKK